MVLAHVVVGVIIFFFFFFLASMFVDEDEDDIVEGAGESRRIAKTMASVATGVELS